MPLQCETLRRYRGVEEIDHSGPIRRSDRTSIQFHGQRKQLMSLIVRERRIEGTEGDLSMHRDSIRNHEGRIDGDIHIPADGKRFHGNGLSGALGCVVNTAAAVAATDNTSRTDFHFSRGGRERSRCRLMRTESKRAW